MTEPPHQRVRIYGGTDIAAMAAWAAEHGFRGRSGKTFRDRLLRFCRQHAEFEAWWTAWQAGCQPREKERVTQMVKDQQAQFEAERRKMREDEERFLQQIRERFLGSDAAILGVSPNASPEEIKSAYRRLAETHHPDKGGDPKTFRRIVRAYRRLTGTVSQ